MYVLKFIKLAVRDQLQRSESWHLKLEIWIIMLVVEVCVRVEYAA